MSCHSFKRGGGVGLVAVSLMMAMCVAALAEPAADKTYAIKLDWREKVGSKTIVEIEGSRQVHQTITVGADAPQQREQKLSVKLHGTVETLSVDDKGNQTQISLTIKDFTRDDGTEILPAGAVVIDKNQPPKQTAMPNPIKCRNIRSKAGH